MASDSAAPARAWRRTDLPFTQADGGLNPATGIERTLSSVLNCPLLIDA
jgi:hypothetical protein